VPGATHASQFKKKQFKGWRTTGCAPFNFWKKIVSNTSTAVPIFQRPLVPGKSGYAILDLENAVFNHIFI
jgi:hypothetical protein